MNETQIFVEPSRELYDDANPERFVLKSNEGVNEEVVRLISKDNNEPEWMLDIRLKGLKLFNEKAMPNFGPDLKALDLNKIIYYAKADDKGNKTTWEEVPEDIKNTFEKLGIPQAEREALAGVGAQYDSQVAYHNLKKEWEDKGVIFEDASVAVHKYPELIKKYFMTNCVPIGDHKFAALHAAVWSGGTFIYVPKDVRVEIPLQAYFRMNARKGGQFEHTLIIADENSEVHYIEGCFTAGNIVTTNPDYKQIENIKEGDKVLSHNGKYGYVYNLQKMPYTGAIYKIKVYGDSMREIEATAEHPFLYVDKKSKRDRNKIFEKRWNLPKFFKKADYLAMPINRVIKEEDYHTFDVKQYIRERRTFVNTTVRIPSTNDFFKLIGYYISEGSISNGSYVNFSFGSHERELIEDVKMLLRKVFGTKFSIIETHHEKNHGTNVVASSVILARIFEHFGKGAANKLIPHWAMLETPKKQKELLKSMFLGDGNYYAAECNSGYKEVFRFSTISEKLALQIRDLLLRQKIVSFLNKRDRTKENRQPMYTIGITGEYMAPFGEIIGIKVKSFINNKNRGSMFGIDDEFAYFPIRSIEKKDVENIEVYNFSVLGTETYNVNGFAVHNCSAPQYDSKSLHAGCVEIYVKKNARVKYSSIENWSRNTYNLNTKRAIVEDNGIIEWINGNMGSGCTMLYPSSILKGNNSRSDSIGIAFAGKGQHQDTGSKVIHIGKNTSSTIKAKSISKDGGITGYRGLVKVVKGACGTKSNVQCDALMVDDISKSDTTPYMQIQEDDVHIGHEATVGKISDEQIFYLTSKGISEGEAMKMIVSGFIEPITKELPGEYAVELNRLIELEMENSIG